MGKGILGPVAQILIIITTLEFCDNCKYPNLNMKFDIRKIVERK